MYSNEELEYRRMQIKVLYSFNNNTEVFLSRSKGQFSVKVIDIPLGVVDEASEEETMKIGAFDLKSCAQQVLKSSPENFRLDTEDYAVYYKDITEQPDEPFVSNGMMSTLLGSGKSHLVPGRVCQNLSASFLFGDKTNTSPLTLEIRLKMHAVEKVSEKTSSTSSSTQQPQAKRPNEVTHNHPHRRVKQRTMNPVEAAKATRTKSLPIFYNPRNQQIFNIINADKANTSSRYDSKSVQDRFKSAPFLQSKVVEIPSKRSRSNNDPQRAMRTRSMASQTPLMISSPIIEEHASDATDGSDDTEYREGNHIVEEDEDDAGEYDANSPFTPQASSYKSNIDSSNSGGFQSLPDPEDLDSKKTHTIPHSKLTEHHGLICTNSNCATSSSIAWRYFETGSHPNYSEIHRSETFDKKHYEGMFGPLCNACYLFLRNKGFMRPEGVVKKYLQQQKYKKELKQREELYGNEKFANRSDNNDLDNFDKKDAEESENAIQHPNSLNSIANRKSQSIATSNDYRSTKFPTPSHTPSTINQVIQNTYNGGQSSKLTPNYSDLNDFMNQLNSFGGPLTDIDPVSHEQQGVTPPMMATKSNTRVINIDDSMENKENCPPSDGDRYSPRKAGLSEFERMMVKSFHQSSEKSSPLSQGEWIDSLLGESVPVDQITPTDHKTPNDIRNSDDTESEREHNKQMYSSLPQLRTFTVNRSSSPSGRLDNSKATVVNMPSSPLVTSTHHSDDAAGGRSDQDKTAIDIFSVPSGNRGQDRVGGAQLALSPDNKTASRINTVNSSTSWNTRKHNSSTPDTDFYSNNDIVEDNAKSQESNVIASMFSNSEAQS